MQVFILGSPWHAVTACAMAKTLPQKSYFVIEVTSESSKKGILEVLAVSQYSNNVLTQVSWQDFSIDNLIKRHPISSIMIVKSHIHQAKKVLNPYFSNLKDVYVFNAQSPVTLALLLDLPKQVQVNKIEDGVVDYLNFKYTGELGFLKNMIRNMFVYLSKSKRVYSSSVFEQHTCHKEFSTFPEKMLLNRCFERVGLMRYKKEIISVLSNLAQFYAIPVETNRSKALIIGQSLFEDRSMSLEDEVKMYERAINKLIKDGIELVYFKPHPRSSESKIQRISAVLKLTESKMIDSNVPVEALMVVQQFSIVVGMWSNPIIFGQKLFDIKPYSLMFEVYKTGKMSPLLERIHRTLLEKFPYEYQGLDWSHGIDLFIGKKKVLSNPGKNLIRD